MNGSRVQMQSNTLAVPDLRADEDRLCIHCLTGNADTMTSCSHLFHRRCLESNVKRGDRCPSCLSSIALSMGAKEDVQSRHNCSNQLSPLFGHGTAADEAGVSGVSGAETNGAWLSPTHWKQVLQTLTSLEEGGRLSDLFSLCSSNSQASQDPDDS
jgi:hypothetical protein